MKISKDLEKTLEQSIIKMIDICFSNNQFNGKSEYIDVQSLGWVNLLKIEK